MSIDSAGTGPVRILDHPAAIDATARIVAGARRTLWIRSLGLEAWLFDHPAVLDALRAFATSGRDVQVLVLLHDAVAPQNARLRLLDLAQRLPSVFQFREVDDPAYREDRAALVASDAGDYYFRVQGDAVEGSAGFDARGRARQLQSRFEEIWERSRPVTEYRALGM